MSALTKKHLIDMHIKVPENVFDVVLKIIQSLDCVMADTINNATKSDDNIINHDENPRFAKLRKNKSGNLLKIARKKEGLTQKELGKMVGIEQANISEMERGKRAITVHTAKKLEKVFNIGYKVFL